MAEGDDGPPAGPGEQPPRGDDAWLRPLAERVDRRRAAELRALLGELEASANAMAMLEGVAKDLLVEALAAALEATLGPKVARRLVADAQDPLTLARRVRRLLEIVG